MESNQENITEIPFQEQWETFSNAVEDRFIRIEDAFISYKGGYNTGTE